MKTNVYRQGAQTALLKSARLVVYALLMFTPLCAMGNTEALSPDPASPAPGEPTCLDRWHHYLCHRVMRLAESINNVVSGILHNDESNASEMPRRFYGNLLTAYQVEGSRIRVTPRIIITDRSATAYKLDFSAHLRLSDISDRLRLYADSYDTDYDTMEDIFSARYRQVLERERSEGATAGLTYFFTDRMKRQLSLSTGLRFRPEPSPKIRLRGRFRKSFDVWHADFSESGFWNEKDGFGERTEVSFERSSGDIHRVRLHSSVVWSELSHGVDWGQFASYYARFSSRRSAAVKLGVRGYTRPSTVVDQYLVRLSYRKRVHRDWLFLEIEPGLDFFREDNYKTTPLINIKLEILIGSFDKL